jgi:ABC-type phosphate transport system substrate-binding protein
MRTRIIRILTILGVLLTLTTYILEAQTYKIIINSSNSTTSLSKSEVSKLFLKKKTKWDNGISVMPVDLEANSKVRQNFSQEIHEKSVGAVRSYWQQAAFSGAASTPPEKSNDQEVIDFVENNSGAIGYISSTTSIISGVKVLTVN